MDNNKSNLIYILEALEDCSDENHYLTQKEIIDAIYQKHGIILERKTIAYNINILRDLDFDIVEKARGKGVALLERKFNKSEVKFIIDALFSSKSIPGKHAKMLSEKISSFLSKYDRKSYNYLHKSSDVSRTDNADVFLNIEVINEAIENGRGISFKYIDFDEDGNQTLKRNGEPYITSPCYLINNFGRYYYLGYREKYHSVSTYRLDYMIDVKIIEDYEAVDPTTLDEFKNYNNIAEYISEHIYLFGGKTIEAKLILNKPYVITYINDWFGKNARIYKENGLLKATVRCNERAFLYWVMQYSEHVIIESPQELIEKVKENAEHILKQYK